MYKRMIFLFFCTLSLLVSGRTVAAGDTIAVIEHANRVVVCADSVKVSVEVKGTKENPNYQFNFLHESTTETVTTLHESSNWRFSLPLQRKPKVHGYHNPDFQIGFSTATGGPSALETPFGKGWELAFMPFQLAGPRIGRHVGFYSGLSFAWRNYRMTGMNRFVKEDNKVLLAPYPDGADIKFSRLKTFSLVVPFVLEVQLPSYKHYSYWFNAGVMANINTYASLKTRYRLDGHKVKEVRKDVHQTPVTLDFYGAFGLNNMGLYVRYSPFHVLESNYGPAFRSLSCGLLFSF